MIALLALAALTADFFVAPGGDDRNPGSQSKPFATLGRARAAVREVKRRQPARDYRVVLRGGIYRLSRTVVFSLEDSAAEGHTITYEAYPGESPVLSSGVPITGWRKEGRLWTAELPAGVQPFVTLYDSSGRLPRARGPAFSPTRDYRNVDGLDRFTLPFPPGAVRNWPNLPDVEILVRPNYGWMVNLLPLVSVDESAGMARTNVAATHPMIKIRWGLRDVNKKGTVWMENALDLLDEPGEWVLDARERRLWLWPRDARPEAVEAPQLTELVRVEGRIDYEGPRDTPVRGLVFRGLGFTRGDRFRWQTDRIGWGLQHDWEMFDRPTALFRVRGGERVTVEKCRFFDSGGAAVRMDLHAQQNRVEGCVIERIGGVGILLAGYGPGTKDVNRGNIIARNYIHHAGQILWHAPGIFLWQSGENRVANNLVHDLHYAGIVVSGRIAWNNENRGECFRTIRWKEVEAVNGPAPGTRPSWHARAPFLHGRNNIVERNEIHNVMQTLWDGNPIYISGTGKGNIVRENFVHDNLSPNMNEGIRCDGDQHGTIIERNVIFRNAGSGDAISSKGVNHLVNNFIVDPRPQFFHRGLIALQAASADGTIIQRNVFHASSPATRLYFQKSLFEGEADPRLSNMKVDHNLYFHTAEPGWAEEHFRQERPHGIEQNSIFGDPMFINPQRGDFRFRPGSPAVKLGIQPLDLRGVGLRGRP